MKLNSLIALLTPLALCAAAAADEPSAARTLIPEIELTDDALPFVDLLQLARTDVARMGTPTDLQATDEAARGVGQFVYPDVAPAVVVIQTYYGHGTGFFIREDGWLLTNNHVVVDSDYDTDLGGQITQITIGRLDDEGWMQVVDRPVRALVYKTDPRRDLALLKLLEMPPGMDEVPIIPFAEKSPMPGIDCVAIGHPATGTLWTLRSGELAGAGIFPRDQMDQILYLLSISSGPDRSQVEQALKNDPERKRVLLSTCGLNPGDSGGPLVNEDGELVAVSYAVPTIDLDTGVDHGKFSFHIHVDEVEEFLSLWPDEPMLIAPNPLPAGMYYQVVDSDKDGYYDTMLIGVEMNKPPVGVLLDLDGDSYNGMSVREIERSGKYFDETGFDFEFASSAYPKTRISYDTDNDGNVDLVFSDEDHDEIPETQLTLIDGVWEISKIQEEAVDPTHFEQTRLQARFKALSN